jgi:ABC-type oligopeptide transport system ATPase subunit
MTVNIVFLIGQPGMGKSTLSMGLEQTLQDTCNLLVIQNHHDRDYMAEQKEALEKGFSSMQDPEYKAQYAQQHLENSRKAHGVRIATAYERHLNIRDPNPFVVLIHLPVRGKIEQYQWTENDYRKFIKDAGIPENNIEFLPSILLMPDPNHFSDEEVIATIKQRYESRCHYKQIQTNEPETDPERVKLQQALDAGLDVAAQLENVKEATTLPEIISLHLNFNESIEDSRAHLAGTLRALVRGEMMYAQHMQGRHHD